MKRILCLLLMALLIIGSFALAEEAPAYWEPVLSDPQNRYANTAAGTEWEGNEEALYALINERNDEAALVEEYGSLMCYITVHPDLNNDFLTSTVPDESNYTIPMCLTIVDGHRLQVLDEGYSAQYITKYCTYYAEDGDMIGRVEIYGGDDSFHAIWEGYRFPFVNPSTALLGLEQDENGYMYLLVSMANDMWIEYVTDATFDLLSLRIYLPDENGVYRLVSLVGWETAPAPEIPQRVLDLIALEPVQ